MTARPEAKPGSSPAQGDAAKGNAVPARASDKPATDNNANWDADEEPWRHPPVAPNDENPARSLGRAVSDTVVSAADEPEDKAARKP
jgi:hypothetical protein